MIQALGFQRFFILLFLVVVAIGLGIANFYILKPQAMAAASKVSALRSEEDQLRTEIETMRTSITTFNEQKAQFDHIEKTGFFDEQDRIVARTRFDTMQKLTKLINAKYEIRSAQLVDPKGVADDKYGLLVSPIIVELSAIDDLDVYRFIYYLLYSFPGHITISDLYVERKQNVTPELLKSISQRSAPEMVGARLELLWTTVAVKGSVPAPVDENQPKEGAAQ